MAIHSTIGIRLLVDQGRKISKQRYIIVFNLPNLVHSSSLYVTLSIHIVDISVFRISLLSIAILIN